MMTIEERLWRLEQRIARSPFAISISQPNELAELGRFRYRVYIEQTGKSAVHADHDAQTLTEPLDYCSVNLLARDEADSLVGCARITTTASGWMVPPQCEPDPWPWIPEQQIACVSRLMIDKNCRSPILMAQLFQACFLWGQENGIRLCAVFCAPKLTKMFRDYGFLPFDEPFFDEYAGWQVPLVASLRDKEIFGAVGSPFLSLIDSGPADKMDEKYMRGLQSGTGAKLNPSEKHRVASKEIE